MGDKEKCREDMSPDNEHKNMLCMDKEMIPCKLIFLVMEACFASGYSFLALFYISSGLSVDRLGLSNSIGSTLSLVASPIWGAFIDSLKKHRVLFFTTMIVVCTAIDFSRPWVVLFVSKTTSVITCLGNSTISNSSLVLPEENCTSRVQLLNADTLFYAVTANGILSALLFAGTMCYVESAIMKTVFTREKSYTYGEQKVFGPIGAAIGAFLAGVAVDHYKPIGLSRYLAAFYLAAPLYLLMLLPLYMLTNQANWEYGRKKKSGKKIPVMKDIMNVVKKMDNLVFLISVFVSGTSLCIIMRYVFIYMDEVMKPSKTMMAMSSVISMMSELAIYPFSSKIIKFVGGQKRCIVLGIFSTALRLIILSYCAHPWQVLAIQPLHGLGMSLGWTAMIEQTWMIFPKDVITTAIGILFGLHWIASDIISNLVGGYLYHTFGGPYLFRAVSIVSGSWVILLFIYYEIIGKRTHDIEACSPSEIGISHNIDIELDEITKKG